MSEARLFVPQEALESWVSEGRAEFGGESLTFEGQRFHVTNGVRFVAEVAGGRDELGLVGRVKSQEQLSALSAEHAGTSVVLGDDAYQVVEGYLLSPAHDEVDPTIDPYPQLISLFARP